uniref:Uncharacterized protein LOC111123609 n=1 Tax=Crassostrea virginica TaxID=6565 RepID=A0A8B8D0T8_CRAVI|nr:uncharacterized protein LOC111123609 [Crassostrea virginica]
MVHHCNEIIILLVLSNLVYETLLLTTLLATITPRQFTSHSAYKTANYPNNYTGEWLIRTKGDNYTIVANLVECDIEAVINKGKTLCSWDWDILSFYEVKTAGNNSDYQYIDSTCCNGTLGDIHSSGSELYVKFTTDGSTSKTGFKISYHSLPPASNHTYARSSLQDSKSSAVVVGIVVGAGVGVLVLILAIVVIRTVVAKKKRLSTVNAKD